MLEKGPILLLQEEVTGPEASCPWCVTVPRTAGNGTFLPLTMRASLKQLFGNLCSYPSALSATNDCVFLNP